MQRIKFPLTKPCVSEGEITEVAKVLRSGWLTQGSYVKALEEGIARYHKVKYALLLNSATSGLIACVKALHLHKNDEIIIPSFSFPATANSVILGGATPVFCDINLNTFNISVEKIEGLITRRTKALMVVHEFGLPAEMNLILKIARKHNLRVIEDAACSLGSEYKGRKAGALGDMGVFSFHPRKIITSGEGGCVITDYKNFSRHIELLRNHGEYGNKFMDVGYNFRLSDIQAAVLHPQFARLNTFISDRIRLAENYDKLLKPLEVQGVLKRPSAPLGSRHSYQSYVILFSKDINRDTLRHILRTKGIETQIGTYCIPTLNFYRKNFRIPRKSYENSYYAFKHSLTLPLYQNLEISGQEFIVRLLFKLIKNVRNCRNN